MCVSNILTGSVVFSWKNDRNFLKSEDIDKKVQVKLFNYTGQVSCVSIFCTHVNNLNKRQNEEYELMHIKNRIRKQI